MDNPSEDKPTTSAAFPGVAEFLFGAGLYAPYQNTVSQARELFGGNWRIDGHCPHCHQRSTFSRESSWHGSEDGSLQAKTIWKTLVIECARDADHRITFEILRAKEGTVLKYGQYPALADIAKDESTAFRKVLSKQNAAEFHRAIGLASHGIGIGSYVYLRRIFERLIRVRFEQFKGEEGWTDEDFSRR
jgi:hypothetical protein